MVFNLRGVRNFKFNRKTTITLLLPFALIALGIGIVFSNFDQIAKLTADDAAAGDYFGHSVAISDDYIVIGSIGDDDGGSLSGSAYIFSRNEGGADNWGQVTKLTADDAAMGDAFGWSVAISEDYIVIGAPQDDGFSGSAYIFSRNEGGADNWGQVAKLTADDGAANDSFGRSVSISDDDIVIGAYGDDNVGSAYIFSRNEGGADNWGQVAKLTADDGAAADYFGESVAISGDNVVIGSYQDDDGGNSSGSAYIFSRNEGGADNWGQVTKLTADDAAAGDRFGYSVSASGNSVVIGADTGADGGIPSGSAYIFSRNEGGADNWGQVTKLTADDGAWGDNFGTSVSINGDYIVIGAQEDDDGGNSSGSAYIFSRNEGGADNWGQVTKLTADDAAAGDRFGNSVSVSGNSVVIGAYRISMFDISSAYIFEANATPELSTPLASGGQATDDSGYYTLTVGVSDDDGDEVSLRVLCDEGAYSDIDVISTSAGVIDNNEDFQISGIDTSSGEVSLTIVVDAEGGALGLGETYLDIFYCAVQVTDPANLVAHTDISGALFDDYIALNTIDVLTDLVLDTEPPTIDTVGTLSISNDLNGDGVAGIGDEITYVAGTVSNDPESVNNWALMDMDVLIEDLPTYMLAATTRTVGPGLLDEAAQTFTVRATDDFGNYSEGVSNAIAVYNIPHTIQFDTDSSEVSETAGSATLTIELDALSGIDTLVDYTIAGTATDGDDYNLAAGTITIDAGEASATLEIPLIDDADAEDDETIIVTLENPIGADLDANDTYTLTVTSDEAPPSGGSSSGSISTVVKSNPKTNPTPTETTEPVETPVEEEPVSPVSPEPVEPLNPNPETTETEQDVDADETDQEQTDNEENVATEESEDADQNTGGDLQSKDQQVTEKYNYSGGGGEFLTSKQKLANFFASSDFGVELESIERPFEVVEVDLLDELEKEELKCEVEDYIETIKSDRTGIAQEYKLERSRLVEERSAIMANLRADTSLQRSNLKAEFQAQIAEFRLEFAQAKEKLTVDFQASLNTTKALYAAEIQTARSNGGAADEIAELREQRTTTIADLRSDYRSQMQALKDELNQKVNTEKDAFSLQNGLLTSQLQSDIEKTKTEYNMYLADLLEVYQQLRQDLNAELKESNQFKNQNLRKVDCVAVEKSDETEDSQDDLIEEIIGTDKGEEDTDNDGSDDFEESFLAFTDPTDGTKSTGTTIGVVGEINNGDQNLIKSNGPVVLTGRTTSGVKCIMESTPNVNFENGIECPDKLTTDGSGMFMLELEPEDGNGNYKFRIEDGQGVVARYELEVDENSGGKPGLYSFGGHKSDKFTYLAENTVVINEKVGSRPVSILKPNGCEVFGQCLLQARWNSLILSSVVLADSNYANFPIIPPKELADGKHRALITSVDTTTNEISGTLEVIFEVDSSLNYSFVDNLLESNWPKLLVVLLILMLAWYVMSRTGRNETRAA